MESNLHLQIKCVLPVRVTRASPGRGGGNERKERQGETERETERGRGWIIVMKRRWTTGWLPRAARVKSSGGFCCVNCALVIHCSPPFHAVRDTGHLKSGTEPSLRQTINGSFAENGMAIDRRFGVHARARDLLPLVSREPDGRNKVSACNHGHVCQAMEKMMITGRVYSVGERER